MRPQRSGRVAGGAYTRGPVQRLLGQLERWIRPVSIPQPLALICAAQLAVYLWILVTSWSTPTAVTERLVLLPARVLEGEWWRPITFLLVPPLSNPIFALFMWICIAAFGAMLERTWGTARLNLFLVIGWVVTVAASFAAPQQVASNGFLGLSVLLAVCTMAPDLEVRLFLVLPVKLRWIGLAAWILIGATIVTGDRGTQLAAVAAILNWCLFLGPQVLRGVRAQRRSMVKAAATAQARREPEPFHRCRICGRTDLSHPTLEFRYCDRCVGAPCYCMDHLRAHEHIGAPVAAARQG